LFLQDIWRTPFVCYSVWRYHVDSISN
jgi:hypothetical protein